MIRYVRFVAEAAWWLLQVGLLLLIEIVSVGFADPRYPSAPRLDRNLRGHVLSPNESVIDRSEDCRALTRSSRESARKLGLFVVSGPDANVQR